MAVVIGSERNIKVTAEDNSTLSKSPTFVCSPDDQVSFILIKSNIIYLDKNSNSKWSEYSILTLSNLTQLNLT